MNYKPNQVPEIDRKCLNCHKPIKVRLSDIKRGWGKFCSKKCKAIEQESRTNQFHNICNGFNHDGSLTADQIHNEALGDALGFES